MKAKFIYLITSILLLQLNAFAQINLIQNPSFEDTISCPGLNSPNIVSALHWRSYRGTPDYLHPCANTFPTYPNNHPVYGVPNNLGGYQTAKHGLAYAGLYTWCCSVGSNNREFIGTQLTSNLDIGTKYYFSCYVSNGDSVESNSSTNNFGMMLSTVPYNGTPGYTMAVTNFSFVKFDSIMDDKHNWVLLSGSFIADSAYRFLALGNFYNYNNTLIGNIPLNMPLAYYYVDAVCLTTDSVYNTTWTSIAELSTNQRTVVYPNPARNYFVIENKSNFKYLSITDLTGRVIKIIQLLSGDNTIETENLENGVYLLQSDRKFSQKLLILKN